MTKTRIGIIGAGSIGTSLGNAIATKEALEVTLYSIEADVVESINARRINNRYFPHVKLEPTLKATTDTASLRDSEFVILALPSKVTLDYLAQIRNDLNPAAPLVNLAKGFSNNHETIAEQLNSVFPNPACSMKGPTFARELIEKAPTAFTFASEDEAWFEKVDEIFRDTPVFVDFSTDLKGVEIISILKNIYAIVLGIVDARFNSPNLRFMLLTKAFKEMRRIMISFGGEEETLFKYCGFGDFAMTALNDLSRNRTLGLFMGKGFFTKDISEKVLLEGKIATQVFCEEISKINGVEDYHIISQLYKVFNYDMSITEFVEKVLYH